MRVRLLLVMLSAIIFIGCAQKGSHTTTYIQPQEPDKFKNEIVIDMAFDEAWSRLLSNLGASFFVVNNIEKASGFINVSHSASEGYPYIDCGTNDVVTTRGKDVRKFSFPIAKSNVYEVDTGAVEYWEQSAIITRKTSVDGRINIHLVPLSARQTKMTVNAKYVFTKSGTFQSKAQHCNNPGLVQYGQVTPVPDYSLNFTTSTMGQLELPTVICVSTGQLERAILQMMRK